MPDHGTSAKILSNTTFSFSRKLCGRFSVRNEFKTKPFLTTNYGYLRAAKLSLLNFLSLFRKVDAIQWRGGVAQFFRDPQKPTRFSGGGSSRNSALSSVAKSHFYPTFSHIRGYRHTFF